MFQNRYPKIFLLLFLFVSLFSACALPGSAQTGPEPSGETTLYLPMTATPAAGITELTLRPQFGGEETHRVVTNGIFAVWWHPAYDQIDEFDLTADAVQLAARLSDVRADSLNELGLQDPPNLAAGTYVNVYIHDPESEADGYPDWWGNGVGTNDFEVPYMTLPIGAHADLLNVAHEGFHIFQYSATNPGYEYEGDSAWFIEASANWYAVHKFHETTEMAFVEAAIIEALPFVTLWRSWDNGAPGDPENWQRLTHQYGMNTFLFYLTEFRNVPTSILTEGYYSDGGESPQRYLYENIPGLQELFGDWAAANVAEFEYMTRAQWARAQEEVEYVADPADIAPLALSLAASGTGDEWLSPPEAQAPRGWSYNVIEIEIEIEKGRAGRYTLEFEGDAFGSEGVASFFEARVVIKDSDGMVRHLDMPLTDGLRGTQTLELGAEDETLLLVIAAVPEFFTGTQTYGYRVRVNPADF